MFNDSKYIEMSDLWHVYDPKHTKIIDLCHF